ncbi:hypothetical protein D3C73_753360 [compost metagenome]
MRFVRHHQMLVGIQDGFNHRDRFLVRNLTKIMNPQTFPVGQVNRDRRTIAIKDSPPGDPVQPLLAANGTEVITQAVEYGRPRSRGQVKCTGLVLRSAK